MSMGVTRINRYVFLLCRTTMVNTYRHEHTMALKPSYRMRGSGNWIAPRAGSYYRVYDDDMYYRGAGFRDWIRQAASTALKALIKFVVPHVKQSGPDLAKMLTKYAAGKASDYIKRTDKLGTSEGLITQALSDLPSVVKDIVQKQIDDRFEPLSQKVLAKLDERGGAASENREMMAQAAVLDAMPYIEEALEPLRRKLSLLTNFGSQVHEGKARDAHNSLEMLSGVLTSENPNGPLFALSQLVESMIVAVYQYLAKTGNLPPSMGGLGESCCRMCSQSNTMPANALLNARTQQYNDLGLNLGNNVNHLAAIMPGLGIYEIEPSPDRGGIVGLGAALLTALVPALVSSGVGLIGSAIEGSRGGFGLGDGTMLSILPELTKQMEEEFKRQSNSFLKKYKIPSGASINVPDRGVTHSTKSAKPPAKRQRLK